MNVDNIAALYKSQQSANRTMAPQLIEEPQKYNIYAQNEPSRKQKIGALTGAVLGTCAALMVLAKFDKTKAYSINPLKMFKGKIKDSYLANGVYRTNQIISMGIGSILGGIIGGSLTDDKKNLKPKLREGIVQIINVSMPIAFVEGLTVAGNYLASKIMPKWYSSKNILKQGVTRLPAAIGAMAGLVGGIKVGNIISNKINEKLFHKKDDRPVKLKDFSAHLDDVAVAATFISPENIVTKAVSRAIPVAIFVPGYESGTKKEVS